MTVFVLISSDWELAPMAAKAAITMAKANLWRARLAVKTLRKDQRAAIAGVGE